MFRNIQVKGKLSFLANYLKIYNLNYSQSLIIIIIIKVFVIIVIVIIIISKPFLQSLS